MECHLGTSINSLIEKKNHNWRGSLLKVVFSENCKFTSWPQNDIEHYKFKGIPYMFYCNLSHKFSQFRSMTNCLWLTGHLYQNYLCEDHWDKKSGGAWKISGAIYRKSQVLLLQGPMLTKWEKKSFVNN